jgi:hypothetical protein
MAADRDVAVFERRSRFADVDWIFDAPSLTPAERLSLVFLWRQAVGGGHSWSASGFHLWHVCAFTGVSPQRTRESLASLVARRWIFRTRDGWRLSWAVPFGDDHGGFVYIVSFSDGTVKVGKTLSPARRLATHASNARRFGLMVDREWSSIRHEGHSESESLMIQCLAAYYPRRGTSEYFDGDTVAFGRVLHAINNHIYGDAVNESTGEPW